MRKRKGEQETKRKGKTSLAKKGERESATGIDIQTQNTFAT